MSEAAASQPPARIRCRRRLAATFRALNLQEAALATAGTNLLGSLASRIENRGTDPIAARIRSIADAQRVPAEADADLPELLARIAGTAVVPAEVCAVAVAILLPILRLPSAPRTTDQ